MRRVSSIRVNVSRGIRAGGGTSGIAGCAAGGHVQGWSIAAQLKPVALGSVVDTMTGTVQDTGYRRHLYRVQRSLHAAGPYKHGAGTVVVGALILNPYVLGLLIPASVLWIAHRLQNKVATLGGLTAC